MTEPARTLVVDWPWKFKDSLPGEGRGASKHYDCMSSASEFALPPIADDCLMFFWRVAAMQREAIDMIERWGFTIKSELVWIKQTAKGNRHFGMGHYVRGAHEVCLIARWGKAKVLNRSTRSVFEAPVGRHSEKPSEFYEIVESLSPGPYTELFARSRRPGWQCFGNELPKVER